jgi:hypothetical protein
MSGLLMVGTRCLTRSGLGLAQDACQPSTVKGPRPVCWACAALQSTKLAAVAAEVRTTRRVVAPPEFFTLMLSLHSTRQEWLAHRMLCLSKYARVKLRAQEVRQSSSNADEPAEVPIHAIITRPVPPERASHRMAFYSRLVHSQS